MSEHTAFVTDFMVDGLEPERTVLDGVADVVALGAMDEAELSGRLAGASALMVYHLVKIGPKTLDALDSCRVIVRGGVGYENIDYTYARSRGIPVVNVPDYGTQEVADSAVGSILALTRGIAALNSQLREPGAVWTHQPVRPLRRVTGMVLGIVGLGVIGTAVALRAKSLGMDIVFFDPYAPSGIEKALGIRRVDSLDDLLPQARVLTLHCRLTPETHHMIDRRALELLPEGSYLVNTARGALVDTAEIPDAIASGRLAGAALDVLETEPPADDDPLIVAWRNPRHPAHDRLLLTPHSAFYSEESLWDLRTKAADACRRAILGLPLRNVVNN